VAWVGFEIIHDCAVCHPFGYHPDVWNGNIHYDTGKFMDVGMLQLLPDYNFPVEVLKGT
jgi:hypothetical protein